MSDLDLIQRCLDGVASTSEQTLVRTDPRLRRVLLAHHRIESGLRAAMLSPLEEERRVAAILSDLRGRNASETVAGIRRAVEDSPRPGPAPGAGRTPRRRLVPALWIGLLAAAAAVVVAIVGPWRPPAPSQTAWQGPVPPPQGIPQQAGPAPKRLVRAGDVLAPRAGERVSGRFEDGSEFTLHGPANLIVGRTLRLQQGRLDLHAAKHPADNPLIVLAPHGRGEVVGTEFTIDAAATNTTLAVREGRVRFLPNGAAGTLVGAGQVAAAAQTARDPIHQPFASDSPWNTALGSGAQFEPISGVAPVHGAHVETREWSVPIFIARPVDPERRIVFRSNRLEAGRVRVDPATVFADREDAFLALVDDRLEHVWEMCGTAIGPAGEILTPDTAAVDLRGSGWGYDHVNHAGASMLGGLIRKGELRGAIRHALAVQVRADLINKTGAPFEWPATKALSSWHRYGTNGNLRLGSLLAIPPSADLGELGLSADAQTVARALQDYGAYVIGTFNGGGKPFVFVAESACDEDVTPGLIDQVSKLAPLLQRVANNTSNTVGGGGTPRQPAPAPLVELAP